MWQVKHTIQAPPAEWEAAFTLRESPEAFVLWIPIFLQSSSSIQPHQLADFQRSAKTHFYKYFNYRFFFSRESSDPKPLLGQLDFVAKMDASALCVRLAFGTGATCLDRWFLGSEPLDWVHELGHQMGLKDEYLDQNSQGRSSAHAADVFHDDSLMANYKDSLGQPKPMVGFRDRHGNHIASLLSEATGIRWTSHAPAFLCFQKGDSLTQMANRLYRNGDKWLDLYERNRTQIPDRFRIPEGTRLSLPAGVS